MTEPQRANRYLGLDLGGTNIKAAVLDDSGILIRESYPAEAALGPEHVRNRLADLAVTLSAEHGPMRAVGVGIPGVLDLERGTTVLLPNLPGPWEGLPVREPIAAAIGMPVTLINDARAFALAESVLGAGRGASTVVCLVLGTGVGGGVVIGGRLHAGTGGAGEIGHQTVLADGPVCGCGNTGCVEALTSAAAFSSLGGQPSPEHVYAAARAGDARARDAVAHVVRWLGIAVANAYVLLAPDVCVVGGGVAAAGFDLFGPLIAEVRRRVRLVPADQIRVVASELGPFAGAIGAALRARDAGPDTRNTASITYRSAM
jgi:glucokinase